MRRWPSFAPSLSGLPLDDAADDWMAGERVLGQPRDGPRSPQGPHVFFQEDKFWFTGADDGL
jgi:hypothetical protein